MKPVLRFAALFAAAIFLISCHSPSEPVQPAVTGAGGKPLILAFHFKDARARLVPLTDGRMPAKGEPDADAATLATHLKNRLKAAGYRIVTSDAKADAVISYTLLAFASTVTEKTFVRYMVMGLDLETDVQMGDRRSSEKNRFQTRQKSINWHLWDTETAQRRHAFAALMATIDEASTVHAFLAKKTSV